MKYTNLNTHIFFYIPVIILVVIGCIFCPDLPEIGFSFIATGTLLGVLITLNIERYEVTDEYFLVKNLFKKEKSKCEYDRSNFEVKQCQGRTSFHILIFKSSDNAYILRSCHNRDPLREEVFKIFDSKNKLKI